MSLDNIPDTPHSVGGTNGDDNGADHWLVRPDTIRKLWIVFITTRDIFVNFVSGGLSAWDSG